MNNEEATKTAAAGGQAALAIAEGCLALAGAAVLRIAAWRLGEAERLIAKMGRRARKLGQPAPALAAVGSSVRTWIEDGPGGLPRRMREERVTVAVTGVVPKVGGYRFLARIEHTEAGNVVTRAPYGIEAGTDLSPYRVAAADCDHCRAARRRKDTFVLRGEDGALLQVGRSCLADFIRSEGLRDGLALWKLQAELRALGGEREEGSGAARRDDIGTLQFIAAACASIRRDGFRKSGAEEGSTKADAFWICMPPPSREYEREHNAAQPTEEDWARAEQVRAWIAETTEPSDYMHNLRVAAACPNVGRRGGLLASAPQAYRRSMEPAAAPPSAPRAPAGAHVGTVGERVDLGDLTIERVRYSENAYGTTTILAMRDASGNAITWFASGSHDYDPGDILLAAKGRVKKHDSYKGTPQTIVNRVTCREVKSTQGAA